jgi:hypothetical protein
MELGFGPEFDSFRAEVRGFLQAHWPHADGHVKSCANERAFVLAAIDYGYLHRSVPRRRFGRPAPRPGPSARR